MWGNNASKIYEIMRKQEEKKSRCLLCVLVCVIAFSVSACGKNQDVQHEQSAVKNETGQAEKELTEKEEVKITSDQKTPVEKKETPIADNTTDTSSEIPDTKTNAEDVQKEPDPSVSTKEKAEDDITENTESDAIESIDEDSYVGEYNSYDTDEPDLEIKKNWDGSYLVQIGMYRLAQLDDCEGKLTEQGLEFSTDEYGKDFSGIITLEDDIATVTFTSEGWKEFADDLNVFKYYKTADVPNIYVPDY